MSSKNPKVDAFLRNMPKWRKEFERLRSILLASPLTEDIKWRLPCYSLDGNNIAILQGFKDYCAVMFFKGALLKDPRGILVAPGASQAGRQIRFTNVAEIARLESAVKAYLAEAIKVEKAGLQVALKKTSDFQIPAEFQVKLERSPALKRAFHALTPGRQRAYLFHFAQPKQSSTRAARVEKCLPMIMKGKGLND